MKRLLTLCCVFAALLLVLAGCVYDEDVYPWEASVIGEIRYITFDPEFYEAHSLRLVDFCINVVGNTFFEENPEFVATGIVATNNETGDEQIFLPMGSAGARLSPPFSFSYEFFAGGRFHRGSSNVFIFQMLGGETGIQRNYQFNDRNALLNINPIESTAIGIPYVYSTRMYFVARGTFVYFISPGPSSGMTDSLRATGVFFGGQLFMPVELITQAWGYIIE